MQFSELTEERDCRALEMIERKLKEREMFKKRIAEISKEMEKVEQKDASGRMVVNKRLETIEMSAAMNGTKTGNKTKDSKSQNCSRSSSSSHVSLCPSQTKMKENKIEMFGAAADLEQLQEAAKAFEKLSLNPVVRAQGMRNIALETREQLRNIYEQIADATKDLRKQTKSSCVCCGHCE